MVAIGGLKCKGRVPFGAGLAVAIALLGCAQDTSRLSKVLTARFAAEGIVRRADNIVFRYTHGLGTRAAGWEDRIASIVVTRQTVYIHKNEKVGLEINPHTRRVCDVERRQGRVRVCAGTGQSAEIWSFVPSDDAEGWTRDLRAAIRSRSPASTP